MTPLGITLSLIILLFSAVIHEVAHGVVALWCGDPTARNKGRLTLNPMSHIDIVFTIVVPLILFIIHSPVLFGGAKPVPINLQLIKHPRLGLFLIAAAGPLSNFIIAFLGGYAFQLLGASQPPVATTNLMTSILFTVVVTNVSLAVFNLFPVPPLDGGQMVTTLLPRFLSTPYQAFSKFGIAFVALIMSGAIGRVIEPIIRGIALWLLGLKL